MNWMIYGATGYTGKITVEEAAKRGHKPIIAGRSEEKLKPLAEKYSLEYRAFNLDSAATVADVLKSAEIELVLLIAGPFVHTSKVMLEACLTAGAHYLDITGEIEIYQNVLGHAKQAQEKNVVLIPGVGFDVVPSDCLAKYVAEKIPNPTHLEVSYHADEFSLSRGTQKTFIEGIGGSGNQVRRNGKLVKVPFASEQKIVQFQTGKQEVVQSLWGDIETSYHTTDIPNITTFFAYPESSRKQLQFLNRLSPLLKIGFIKNFFLRQIDKLPPGPTPEQRKNNRTYIHAKVSNAEGQSAEAWLETCEAYQLTAYTCVRAVEQVLDGNYSGAMTPATAFGADFILDIEGSIRQDTV